jgi:ABC-type cobalamin/Fe3+-siderophores transport system ATPase subunit
VNDEELEKKVGAMQFARLRFQAGSRPRVEPLEVEPATVMVLVGPNNSGKSLALREIETWCSSADQDRKVVDSIEVEFPPDVEGAKSLMEPFIAWSEVGKVQVSNPDGTVEFMDWNCGMHRPSLGPGQSVQTDRFFENQIQLNLERMVPGTGDMYEGNLRSLLTRWHVIRLDGRRRFELTDSVEGGDLTEPPANHLLALAQNGAAREEVRKLTFEAFRRYFVLDFLKVGWVRIRMSRQPPGDDDEELGLGARAQAFHREATLIEEMGDGAKCFTGLVAAVLSQRLGILLIDEPEAFLHPPLARLLGRGLGRLARERQGSLIVATHSAEFLMGCVESGSNTTVVRLGYEDEVATARQLPATDVQRLAQDPFLRSTDVLRALFHRGAIVCESDTDRVVYDEMNRRLLDEDRGVRDVLFLNTQGESNVQNVVGSLRQLGVPAVAIVDLDFIRSSKWHGLLAACGVSEERRRQLDPERLHLRDSFDALAKAGQPDPMKRGGIEELGATDRARAEAFLGDLASYGLFLAPIGELEAWLRSVGATGNKTAWVTSLFGLIGSAPDDEKYLRPGDDDIWAFIDRIRVWVDDPERNRMTVDAAPGAEVPQA